jgi:hypothetical protein
MMNESIRGENVLSSIAMLAISILRSGFTLMIFTGAYLPTGSKILLSKYGELQHNVEVYDGRNRRSVLIYLVIHDDFAKRRTHREKAVPVCAELY